MPTIRTSRVPVRAGSRATVMYLQAAADTMVLAPPGSSDLAAGAHVRIRSLKKA